MTIESLIASIEQELLPLGFKRHEGAVPLPDTLSFATVRAAWKRKTFNTNRGVLLVELSEGLETLDTFAGEFKTPAGKAIGYIPFLYGLGLQLVAVGKGKLQTAEELKSPLDVIDNQTVLLQSLHAIDLESRESVSVRTWGQVITGKFQDAIEKGVGECLAQRGGVGWGADGRAAP